MWFASSQGASSKKKPPPVPKTTINFTQIWLESFDFFVLEQDDESIAKLTEQTLTEPTDNVEIMTRIFEHQLTSKNRLGLIKYASDLSRALHCDQGDTHSLCEDLAGLWHGNLDSVLFYESSAGTLLKARKAIETKDCPGALALMRETLAKEGDAKPVLEMLLDVQNCLGDTTSANALRQRIAELTTIGLN